jgi:hypothetical protein
MPDISPLTNGLLWSLAVIFGCWIAMQLLDAAASFRDTGPPEGERPFAEPPSSGGSSRSH